MKTNKPTPLDLQRCDALAARLLQPDTLPVACTIGGRKCVGIPNATAVTTVAENGVQQTVLTGLDPSGIEFRAECVRYPDFPVLEWTLWLTNTAEENSPIITDFCGMEGILPGTNPVVYYNVGDSCQWDYFQEHALVLRDAQRFVQHPDGGRSSDCAWPYYRVLCDDFGYNLSIGWPGQWESEFAAAEDGFFFRARQQYARFYLKPGETVRTARMTVMPFEGDSDRGKNMWRRWMMAYILPREARPFLSLSDNGGGVEFVNASEENQLNLLDKLKASDILPDLLWIDAGWYRCTDPWGNKIWRNTAALEHDRDRFPAGLKPVGDRCREYGVDFLMWFEPERVRLCMENRGYPDRYLLFMKDPSQLSRMRMIGSHPMLVDNVALFNLGNPEARQWLTDRIDALIKEYGITVYRQDFNFSPLLWWLQNDDEDRLGITENLYNQGYLRFWDDLRARNPGLLINSVASGGRRSDLESMRRSVSFHQSDYGHGNHPTHLAHLATSYEWLVYTGSFAVSSDNEAGEYDPHRPYSNARPFDNFCGHTHLTASLGGIPVGRTCAAMAPGAYAATEECAYFRKFRAIWQRAIPYTLNSDYYTLRLSDRSNMCWHAVQFHNEEKNEGILQAIRGTRDNDPSVTLRLKGMDPEKTYFFESPEFGRSLTVSGAQLLSDGFTVTLPRRTGEIWFYKAV